MVSPDGHGSRRGRRRVGDRSRNKVILSVLKGFVLGKKVGLGVEGLYN